LLNGETIRQLASVIDVAGGNESTTLEGGKRMAKREVQRNYLDE
jgi:hypothetical protein